MAEEVEMIPVDAAEPPKGASYREWRAPVQQVREHVKGFLPYLEQYDMKLVLETHGDHGTGKILGEICSLVGSDRVLINYDTANAVFYGALDNEALLADFNGCRDEIGYMHIKEKLGGRKEWKCKTDKSGIRVCVRWA